VIAGVYAALGQSRSLEVLRRAQGKDRISGYAETAGIGSGLSSPLTTRIQDLSGVPGTSSESSSGGLLRTPRSVQY